MKNNYLFLLAFSVLAAMFVVSCNNKGDDTSASNALVRDFDNEVIVKWNDVFLQVERYAGGYRPGPAPRALGLLGLANYEACVSGMPEFNSIAGLYAGLSIPKADANQTYHWPTVINASYSTLLKQFFATQAADKISIIDGQAQYFDSKFKAAVDADVFERSQKLGKDVANAVWEWSKTDTYGHDAYFDPFGTYKWEDHYDAEGDWKPTYPGPGKPMFPNWGKARTFAITEAEKLCPAPLPYSTSPTSALYAQALETYALSGTTQSYDGKWIAEFWSDDLVGLTFSPGPRWIAIANQVYQAEKCNLETAIWANAKVGMATNDAAVSCWFSKYVYNVERPQTYIQRFIDPTYEPALDNPLSGDKGITPSFPAYPSGHATMGAAGAEALSSVFGYDYALTDRCHETRSEFVGTPRAFNSFYEMAEENAWSRVPLGVHYRMDAEQGVNLGYRCGRKVNNLPWKK